MSATFYERMMRSGDWENDGGSINYDGLYKALRLFESSLVDDDYVAVEAVRDVGTTLTTPQRADLDDVLATMPNVVLSALNATARARWTHKIYAISCAALDQRTGFTTEAMVKTALGV